MPKQYDIDQIRLMAVQRALARNLKKGDFIYVGQEVKSEAEKILTDAGLAFVSLPHSFNIQMIVIN